MFWRILWRLLYASRGRLALAVIAVASGAAVCAALLNLNLDASDKLTREFRVLGANVVVSAAQSGDAAATMDAGSISAIEELRLHLDDAGIEHEVEIYPGAEHGFAFPQRAAYRKAAAERHWERLFALFRRKL